MCGAEFTLNYTFTLDPTLGAWGVPLAALSVQSSRCRSPMLSHSHSDGEFPIKQGEEKTMHTFRSSYFEVKVWKMFDGWKEHSIVAYLTFSKFYGTVEKAFVI